MWKHGKFSQAARISLTVLITIVIIVGIMARQQQEEDIFDEIEYEVIQLSVIPELKYSVDLRLQKPISEEKISKIFYSIRNDNGPYEQYSVHFYLPGMEVGAGAWAVVNYDDNKLVVEILRRPEDRS